VIEGREGRLDDLFAVEADLLIQGHIGNILIMSIYGNVGRVRFPSSLEERGRKP
jgi:hypothetical protein